MTHDAEDLSPQGRGLLNRRGFLGRTGLSLAGLAPAEVLAVVESSVWPSCAVNAGSWLVLSWQRRLEASRSSSRRDLSMIVLTCFLNL